MLKQMEPRITKSMTKGSLQALFTGELDVQVNDVLNHEIITKMTGVDGLSNDISLKEWMRVTLLAQMGDVYSKEELETYSNAQCRCMDRQNIMLPCKRA